MGFEKSVTGILSIFNKKIFSKVSYSKKVNIPVTRFSLEVKYRVSFTKSVVSSKISDENRILSG